MKTVARIIAFLLLLLAAVLVTSVYWWNRHTKLIVSRLRKQIPAARPAVFRSEEFEGLPSPVARYFRAVLRDGQPMIRYARLTQRGQFFINGWRPFDATEYFATNPPAFVWDARIRMVPRFNVRVRDAFVGGSGSMRASALGVWTVAATEGTPEIAAGALHRYLAEAVWFPTALLPSQGVIWSPLDETSARAALSVGGTTVSLDFFFDADGLVTRVFTPSRARDVNGRGVPTPWQGRFSHYELRDAVRVPIAAEVEWLLPSGPQSYWRGENTDSLFEYQN